MEASIPSTGKGPLANLAARRAAGEIHADPVVERLLLVAALHAGFAFASGPKEDGCRQ